LVPVEKLGVHRNCRLVELPPEISVTPGQSAIQKPIPAVRLVPVTVNVVSCPRVADVGATEVTTGARVVKVTVEDQREPCPVVAFPARTRQRYVVPEASPVTTCVVPVVVALAMQLLQTEPSPLVTKEVEEVT
jgi:hypothetical protein